MTQTEAAVYSENAFREEYFRGGLGGAYWAAVLGALSYGVFMAVAFLTEEYSASAQTVRGAVVSLLGFVCLLLAKYPTFVLRNYEFVVGGASLFALMATVFLLSLGPTGHPTVDAGASPAIIFALFIHYSFLRMSFAVAACVGLSASVIYFIFGAPLAVGGNELLRSCVYLILANAVGAMVCRTNLSRERILFKERVKVQLAEYLSSSRAIAAENANLQKSRLLSLISHDIKTPLHSASLSLRSGLIAAKPERGNLTYQALVDASDSIGIVQMTLNHVLVMERLDPVVGCLPIDEVCLNSLLKRMAVNLDHEADALGVPLEIPNPGGKFVVISDEGAVWQILMNLVRNALKFSSIKAGNCGFVKILVDAHPKGVRVRVLDTGVGIERRDQSLMWGAYYRANRDSGSDPGGMGLGLYMTKRTLEVLQGHSIRVTSKFGVGSIFTLLLPGRKRRNYGAYDDVAGMLFGKHDVDAFAGCYVLVVCDDQGFGNAICDFLDEIGCVKYCISVKNDFDVAFSNGDRLVDFVLVCVSEGFDSAPYEELSRQLLRLRASYQFVRADVRDITSDFVIDAFSFSGVLVRKFDAKYLASEILLGSKRNQLQETRGVGE